MMPAITPLCSWADPSVAETLVAGAALIADHLPGEDIVQIDVFLPAHVLHVVFPRPRGPDVAEAARDQGDAVASLRRLVGVAGKADELGG